MRKLLILAMVALPMTMSAQRHYRSCDDVYYAPQSEVVSVVEGEKNVIVRHEQVINYYHENVVTERHYGLHDDVPNYVCNKQPTYSNEGFWTFYFGLNSSQISNKEVLGDMIEFSYRNPNVTFYIDSYGDAGYGTWRNNEIVSERRANAIRNYLIREGVKPHKIKVRCWGSYQQRYNTNELNRCAIVKAFY